MRVLLVTESKGWSGGAAQALLLAQWLRDHAHSVWIACRPDSEIARRAHASGVLTLPIYIRGDLDLLAVVKLGCYVKQYAIDVVHAQHAKAHGVAWLAKCLFHRDKPFVVTRRVSFPVATDYFSRIKYHTPMINRYIAVSKGVKQVLVQAGVPDDRVDVIYSAVDPAAFQPSSPQTSLRQALGFDSQRPVVIKVANYAAWKGQAIFLEAAALNLRKGGKAQFALAGRDTDGLELRALLDSLNLNGAVRLLGFRTDVPDLLAIADISVNAALEGEGLSGALRESLLLGVPVIASDVSGNSELVQSGVTGQLVPPGDPQALADAIQWALENREKALEMAHRGQQDVLKGFSIQQTGTQIENLYTSLLRRTEHVFQGGPS